MKKLILAVALLVSGVMGAVAQDKGTFTVGADLVSSYVWRGLFQNSNACFQPTLGWGYKGFSVSAWGSTDFSVSNQEFDLSASYTLGGLKVGLTDYWWSGEQSTYFKYKDKHYFEGTLGYTFGFGLSLTGNMIFAGASDSTATGKQAYSTYIEAAYPFKVGAVDLVASVGMTPSLGMYSFGYDGIQLCTVALKASKTIKVSESLSFPLFVQAVIAPTADHTHLVVGATF